MIKFIIILLVFGINGDNINGKKDNPQNEGCRRKYIECKDINDGILELKVNVNKRIYKKGIVKIEQIELRIKNISGDRLYLPGDIGYGGPLGAEVEIFINDKFGNKTKRYEINYGNWGDKKSLVGFEDLTLLYPFHSLCYTYNEEEFLIEKKGKYTLRAMFKYGGLKKSIKSEYKNRVIKENMREKIEKIWEGCLFSEPIEIEIVD